MDRFLNLELLRQPLNWLIVIMMLAIFVFGLNLLQPALSEIQTATMQVV
jgi:hypothetical protein